MSEYYGAREELTRVEMVLILTHILSRVSSSVMPTSNSNLPSQESSSVLHQKRIAISWKLCCFFEKIVAMSDTTYQKCLEQVYAAPSVEAEQNKPEVSAEENNQSE